MTARLKEQRQTLARWFHDTGAPRRLPAQLADLLAGRPVHFSGPDTLDREALLALRAWILDYADDGARQGFPFDPHALYLHERIVRAARVTAALLNAGAVRSNTTIWRNFQLHLDAYLTDPGVIEAARLYQTRRDLFNRLREALRLDPKGPTPMYEAFRLGPGGEASVQASLLDLRADLAREALSCPDAKMVRLYQIVLTHLDVHWPGLFGAQEGGALARTTTDLERFWHAAKSGLRRTHGRRKLTRDFRALPPEVMLVYNLDNPVYRECVLGGRDGWVERLTKCLADAGQTAEPYSHWRKRQTPASAGRVPLRLLRHENFPEELVRLMEAALTP